MTPVTRPFDSQQERLYEAQLEAFRYTTIDNALSSSECHKLNKLLFEKARAAGHWSSYLTTPSLTVVEFLPDDYAAEAIWQESTQAGAIIRLTSNAKRGWVVAHEAAHIILMAGKPQYHNLEMHGKEFVAVYIWAVRALFGTELSNRLKRVFAKASIAAYCTLADD